MILLTVQNKNNIEKNDNDKIKKKKKMNHLKNK